MAVGVASPRAAGAGYDEHGKGGQQSVGEPVGRIKCKPDEETGYGDGYYRRDEERGHSVNRPLDWGLAVLRISYEPDDAGQCSVFSNRLCSIAYAALSVHCSGKHLIARFFPYGYGFACEHAVVDICLPFRYAAVHSYSLARMCHQDISRHHISDVDLHFLSVRQHCHSFWTKSCEFSYGGSGVTPRLVFEKSACEDKCYHH